ncbi:MAG TPA: tetratricopeptide repeat protein, partial [Pseudonocardiaceae bacterium]
DETVFDTPAVMDSIAADFAKQRRTCDEYVKQSETYRKHKHDLDADPTAPEGLASTLTKSAVRIGLRMTEDVPIAGSLAKELNADVIAGEADRIRVYLSQKLRNHRDVRLVLSPLDELTPTFVKDLQTIANQQPIALFFDTYERSAAFLDHWLLGLLSGRYGDLPPNIVITIAGQYPLDVNAWGDYLTIRLDTELKVFSEAEARELLTARNITDPAIIDVILGLTGRLPVLVAMLAETRPGSVDEINDPSDNAVERFLKWEKDEQRRTAALRGALPRRLDSEIFTVLTGAAEAEFLWLLSLPFVSEQADGYRYHDVVRDAMLRVQRRRSLADLQQRHAALAEHYGAARDAMELSGRKAWRDSRWLGYAIEGHYHRLCAQPASTLPAAIAGLIDTMSNQWSSAPLWATMISQAGRDARTETLVAEGDRLSAWLVDQEGRIPLLSHLIKTYQPDDHHRALAYRLRAYEHHTNASYDDAVADYTRAIHLEPTDDIAFAGRGDAHRLADRNEDALADFDRAIELDPQYKWAIFRRGLTYQQMQRYHDALADINRAIEFDAESPWYLGMRGQIYRSMARYDEALAELNRAVELDSESDWGLANRGEIHRLAGRYDEALADFDRAIELDPQYDWAIASRGQTYGAMDRYQEALTDLHRAIEIDPTHTWAVGELGETYLNAGRHNEAVNAFTRVIDMEPNPTWAIVERSRAYQAMNKHDEALADLDRAIQIEPDYKWALALRGRLHRMAGRYGDAMADLNRAVDVDPEYAWAITNRAQTYHLLGQHDRAIADLDRAVEADPESTWAIQVRGELHRAAGRYADALADFNRDIELDPNDDSAIAGRGRTYRAMGLATEALNDLRRAAELDPDYGIYRYGIWLMSVAADQTDDIDHLLHKAIELDRTAIPKEPLDTAFAFNIALYLRALGEIEPAVLQARAALAGSTDTLNADEMVEDLDELHDVTGRDVDDLLRLLDPDLT